jgi:hypothetical protein
VAVGGLFVAGWFLMRGDEARGVAAGFGVAFATTSAIVFFATVPGAQWAATYCDAYSVAQFAIGTLAGVGLATIAASRRLSSSLARRAAALTLLGAAAAVLAVALFPQCLKGPYVDLAPMLRSYWLDMIGEAQPVWSMLASEPEAAAGHYATVLIALAVLGLRLRKTGARREDVLLAAMLIVAFLVSVWQVRGSRFSLPLACVPLAMWVGEWRGRAQAVPGTAVSLKLAGAWLVSFHVAWILAALGAWYVLAPASDTEKPAASECYKRTDYAVLAAMTPTRVLAISNLGSPTLLYTPHNVLAGPYHRNVAGNLAALEAFVGSPETAREVTRRYGVELIAFCRDNSETAFLAKRAPDGLLAGLIAGKVPNWMAIVPESAGKPLQIYRVAPSGD